MTAAAQTEPAGFDKALFDHQQPQRSNIMSISDTLIHINQCLNENQRKSLEESMRQINGVVAPRFNPEKDHLLLVAFNPAITSTEVLLTKVESFGYNAQLIGM